MSSALCHTEPNTSSIRKSGRMDSILEIVNKYSKELLGAGPVPYEQLTIEGFRKKLTAVVAQRIILVLLGYFFGSKFNPKDYWCRVSMKLMPVPIKKKSDISARFAHPLCDGSRQKLYCAIRPFFPEEHQTGFSFQVLTMPHLDLKNSINCFSYLLAEGESRLKKIQNYNALNDKVSKDLKKYEDILTAIKILKVQIGDQEGKKESLTKLDLSLTTRLQKAKDEVAELTSDLNCKEAHKNCYELKITDRQTRIRELLEYAAKSGFELNSKDKTLQQKPEVIAKVAHQIFITQACQDTLKLIDGLKKQAKELRDQLIEADRKFKKLELAQCVLESTIHVDMVGLEDFDATETITIALNNAMDLTEIPNTLTLAIQNATVAIRSFVNRSC